MQIFPASRLRRISLLLIAPAIIQAQVVTWIAPGPDGPAQEWTNGANWDTGTTPDSPTAIAVINTVTDSDTTGTHIVGAARIETTPTTITLDELRYEAPAGSSGVSFPRLTLTSDPDFAFKDPLTPGAVLNLTGGGITMHNAGSDPVSANLTMGANSELNFHGSARISAPDGTTFTISRNAITVGPSIHFYDNSSAGSARILIESTPAASITFNQNSTAETASLRANSITFRDQSTAADATIQISSLGSRITFQDQAHASNASIMVSPTRVSDFGTVEFRDAADAGTATITFTASATGSVVIRDNASTAGLTIRGGDGLPENTAGLNISDAAGDVTLRSVSGWVNVQLGDNTLRLLGDGNEMLLRGHIAGSGGLIFDTGNTIVLTNPNSSYTGPTLVQSGSLHLSSARVTGTTVAFGASLTGTGTVDGDLINHGMARPASPPGNPLIVEGDFIQAADGILMIGVESETAFDRVVVGENATLDGTLILTISDTLAPASGADLQILTAKAVTGEFAEIAGLPDFGIALSPLLVYSPTGVHLQINQNPFAGFADGSAGSAALGAHLDATQAGSTGAYRDLIAVLNGMTHAEQISKALAAMSPDRYSAFMEFGFINAAARQAGIDRLFSTARDGTATGFDFFFDVSHRKADFDAVADLPAAAAESTGGTAGGIWRGDAAAIGASIGRETGEIDLDPIGSQTDLDSVTFAIFVQFAPGPLFFNVSAGYSRDDYDLRRRIVFDGADHIATASPSGNRTDVALNAGYTLSADSWTFTPAAGLLLSRVKLDRFEETGADGASMVIEDFSAHSKRARLGFEAVHRSPGGRFSPRLAVSWLHELDDDRSFDARFAGAGSSYTAPGRTGEKRLLQATLGIEARLADRMILNLGIAGARGSTSRLTSDLSAGLRWVF